MTLQSYPSHSEEVVASGASSSSSSASTSSTDVCPLPLSIGQKEIVLSNDERALIAELPDVNLLAPGANINITDSTNVDVGNRTTFNRDVTIYQIIQGSTLPEIQNGVAGHEEVVCNKNVRVIPPPPVSPTTKPNSGTGIIRRHFKAIMILLTLATVICAVTLITLRLVGTKKPSYVPTITTEEPTSTVDPPAKLHHVITKDQWGGRQDVDKELIEEPAELVIIKHTNTQTCWDPPSCFSAMQNLQNDDVGINKLLDIRYNFVIGGDGNIYEGRGCGVRNEQMNNTIDIAYMGNFNVDVPSEFMAGAGNFMTVRGMFNGHLDPSKTRVVCHNQTEDTDSPGVNLYKEVITWKLYSDEIINNTSQKHDLQ